MLASHQSTGSLDAGARTSRQPRSSSRVLRERRRILDQRDFVFLRIGTDVFGVFADDATIGRDLGVEIDCATAEMIGQPSNEDFSPEP